MPLCDILVHLDASPRTAGRLALAIGLARRDGARIAGIFAQCASAYQVGVVAAWPPESYVKAAAASREQFEAATSELKAAEWMDINRGGDQEIVQRMIEVARHYDLTVLGQYDEAAPKIVPRELMEQVIVESGRPVLVVPYAGQFPTIGRRPLIAWTDARSAARALNDSLLLIEPGAEAALLSVGPGTEAQRLSAGRAAQHLQAHKIGVQIDTMPLTETGLMDALLNLAADKACDLAVLGAFGSYGYPLLNRGAGTQFMLRHMTVPCLFSH